MTVTEIETRLKVWADLRANLQRQRDALSAVLMTAPEAPLFVAMDAVWTAYTVAMSELIGDADEWLQWYEFECDMGRRPKEVHRKWSGQPIKVRTLKQLARVIHG